MGLTLLNTALLLVVIAILLRKSQPASQGEVDIATAKLHQANDELERATQQQKGE